MVDPDPADHAVVWIEEGEVLPVRESAGISAAELGALTYDQHSIRLTGSRTALGSSTWVEIEARSGLVGWIPGWNLTEDVPAEGFCRDARIEELARGFEESIEAQDPAELAKLLSPKRNLILRFDPWNPETRIGLDDLPGLFDSPQSYVWGKQFASGVAIEGSFSDIVLPNLVDVFSSEHEVACNEILMGSAPNAVAWPSEYTNLNFLSFHRPAPDEVNTYNWRSWIVAIEYLGGEPYIALLLQLRPPF